MQGVEFNPLPLNTFFNSTIEERSVSFRGFIKDLQSSSLCVDVRASLAEDTNHPSVPTAYLYKGFVYQRHYIPSVNTQSPQDSTVEALELGLNLLSCTDKKLVENRTVVFFTDDNNFLNDLQSDDREKSKYGNITKLIRSLEPHHIRLAFQYMPRDCPLLANAPSNKRRFIPGKLNTCELLSFLDSHGRDFTMRVKFPLHPDRLKKCRRILVDGYPFCHYFIQCCAQRFPNGGSPLDGAAAITGIDTLGGDNWQLARLTESFVRTVYEWHHVELVFVLCGKLYNHKEDAATTKKMNEEQKKQSEFQNENRKDRFEAPAYLPDYCFGATSRTQDPQQPPALAYHQMVRVLQRLDSARVVYVRGELEDEVAALVKLLEVEMVLTDKVDLCLVSGVSTMLLRDLVLAHLVRADGRAVPNEEAQPLKLRCFSAAKLCTELQLSQSELEQAASFASANIPGHNLPFMEEKNLQPLTFAQAVELVKSTRKEEVKKRNYLYYVKDTVRYFKTTQMQTCSLYMDDKKVERCQTLPPCVHTLYCSRAFYMPWGISCAGRSAYGHKLQTIRRILTAIGTLFGHKQMFIYEGTDQAQSPHYIDLTKLCDTDKLTLAPLQNQPSSEDIQAFLEGFFYKKPDKKRTRNDFFTCCVLWTMQAGLLNKQELQQVVYTMALTRALSVRTDENTRNCVKQVLEHLVKKAKNTPPTPRAVELADLFALSYEMTHALFAVAYGQMPAAADAVLPLLPEPCDLFSGVVLHLVLTYDLSSKEKLLQEVQATLAEQDTLKKNVVTYAGTLLANTSMKTKLFFNAFLTPFHDTYRSPAAREGLIAYPATARSAPAGGGRTATTATPPPAAMTIDQTRPGDLFRTQSKHAKQHQSMQRVCAESTHRRHIFCDGSHKARRGEAGHAAVCYEDGKLGPALMAGGVCEKLDRSESLAVEMALDALFYKLFPYTEGETIVIFSDRQNLLTQLDKCSATTADGSSSSSSSNNKSDIVRILQRIAQLNANGLNLKFSFIFSHSNVSGNEMADRKAREALMLYKNSCDLRAALTPGLHQKHLQ